MRAEPDCIFCGIVAGEISSTTMAQSETAIAFMDINPVTPGHALVAPRSHATDLFDITADDLAACVHLAQQIAGRAKDRLGADGVNLLHCSGEAAWQSVFHFHIHVIPRFKDVKVYVCHPGSSSTSLITTSGNLLTRAMFRLMSMTPMVRSAEKGAYPQVMCATEDDLDQRALYGPTGWNEWVGPVGKGTLEPFAYEKPVMERLWELSEKETGHDWDL